MAEDWEDLLDQDINPELNLNPEQNDLEIDPDEELTIIQHKIDIVNKSDITTTDKSATNDTISKNPISIHSFFSLPGWKLARNTHRTIFMPKGYILNSKTSKYREKSTKDKKSFDDLLIPVYQNTIFTSWQKTLTEYLNQGHHVILNIATSCGKTFATISTVAYETLSTDNRTALIIAPNAEVLREDVEIIGKYHDKKYLYNRKVVDTQTKNYSTYMDDKSPNSQIICITIDNFTNFILNGLNMNFLKSLKFIVFDEVHLPEISTSILWSSYLPHDAQFILLSATMGTSDTVIKKFKEIMNNNGINSSKKVKVIEYAIRPIPLQNILFKDCSFPIDGYNCSTLKKAGKIACQVSYTDPTLRDLKQLKPDLKLREVSKMSRDEQYELGQEILKRISEIPPVDFTDILTDISEDYEKMYKLFAYLFANDLAPVLYFHTSSGKLQTFCKQFISYINNIENQDKEFLLAQKFKDKLKKIEKRMTEHEQVDEKKQKFRSSNTGTSNGNGITHTVKSNKYRDTKMITKVDHTKKSAGTVKLLIEQNTKQGITGLDQEGDLLNHEDLITEILNDNTRTDEEIHAYITEITEHAFKKWKFPATDEFNDLPPCPTWVKECLHYGIGVYMKDFKAPLRYYIFDLFKEGKIKILISDLSISVGINLPARTCILAGDITSELYKQLGGRAGRRGYDNQGYVLPICSKDRIERCLRDDRAVCQIHFPQHFTYLDLLKLHTPLEMDTVIFPDQLINNDIGYIKSYILKKYSTKIQDTDVLNNYHSYIKDFTDLHLHTCRLTNLINKLPFNETLMIIKMLIQGEFNICTSNELISIISMLFEWKAGSTDNPDLISKFNLKTYDSKYHILFTYNNYFELFCKESKLYTEDIDNILKIGEWIYVFKDYIRKIAPVDDHFRLILEEVDMKYTIACKRNNINEIDVLSSNPVDIITNILSRICKSKITNAILSSLKTDDHELFIEYSDEILKRAQIIEGRTGVRVCSNLSVLKAFEQIKKQI